LNIKYRAQASSTVRAGSPHGSKGNVAVIAKFFGALLNTYTGMCIAVTQHKPLFQPLEKAFLSRYARHMPAAILSASVFPCDITIAPMKSPVSTISGHAFIGPMIGRPPFARGDLMH
jgi:hypothetical protein